MNATDNTQTEDNTQPADTANPADAGLSDGRGMTGKIARLPLAIRRELQKRLLDGRPAGQLLPWLNGLPEVQAVLAAEFEGRPITKQNLRNGAAGTAPAWRKTKASAKTSNRCWWKSMICAARPRRT
jgi:hypothetical protein